MESLERLSSSIAQVELLLASLKRENRDLAARLASAAAEHHEARAEAEARIEALALELRQARESVRPDPEWEARGLQAQREAADLARDLASARARHLEERGRWETLIRQLEAQVMASHGLEQLPVASAETLEAAHERERRALAGQAEAQERALALAAHLKDLQARLDAFLLADDRSARETEALKGRLASQAQRVAELEGGLDERQRLLGEAQTRLAGAAKLEVERAELKRQKREAAAFSRERHALRRRVEELLITLESVRLG